MRFIIVLALFLAGCEQTLVRNLGAGMTVKLKPNEKLVNASWKGDQLWYLTRSVQPNEKPEVHVYKESSKYGILEGKVTFIEQ